MKLTIHSIRFDADQKLEEFIEKKIQKLERVFDNIVSIEVFLRVVKPQANNNKLAEIKLEIAGNDLFAKKQTDTFEESVDQCIDALRTQLKKHKEKVRG